MNINQNQITNIHNHWNNAVLRPARPGWNRLPPGRYGYWNRWGNGIRDHWWHQNWHSNWFGPNWWANHPHGIGGWHYWHNFSYHPWEYWWTVPTYAAVTGFFNWGAQPAWQQPIYYDYGTGGNVTYQNNTVYVGGTEVGSSSDFAQSAADLATVPAPPTEEAAEEAEWMPLGTFAVSTNEKDQEPSRIIQLAVNKEGVISGTLFNRETDQTTTVQGRVDKETQRVAMRIGSTDDVVMETGLYNLTQDEAAVLVHFGTDKVENYLFVRLTAPPAEVQPEES